MQHKNLCTFSPHITSSRVYISVIRTDFNLIFCNQAYQIIHNSYYMSKFFIQTPNVCCIFFLGSRKNVAYCRKIKDFVSRSQGAQIASDGAGISNIRPTVCRRSRNAEKRTAEVSRIFRLHLMQPTCLYLIRALFSCQLFRKNDSKSIFCCWEL